MDVTAPCHRRELHTVRVRALAVVAHVQRVARSQRSVTHTTAGRHEVGGGAKEAVDEHDRWLGGPDASQQPTPTRLSVHTTASETAHYSVLYGKAITQLCR